jgi:hypothetical protein
MPVYANNSPPSSIEAGAVQNVWATGDGNLTSGTKTQRVALVQRPGGEPIKVAFRCAFSAAPGVIALQLQTSDTDVDTDYVNEGAAISTVNASNVAPRRIPQCRCKFARHLASTVTNTVTATAPPRGLLPPKPLIDAVFTIPIQFLRYNPRTN